MPGLEAASAGGRGAGRLEAGYVCVVRDRVRLAYIGLDIRREDSSCNRLRVSPLGGGDGAATTAFAAAGVPDDGLLGLHAQRILAVMNSLP